MSEERAFMREAMRELGAQKKVAVNEWLEGRAVRGITRFTDKDALRRLRIVVERSLLQDDWRDVIAAVRQVARDPYGTVWTVQAAASEIGASRREREHVDRKLRERAEGYGTGV